MNISDNIIKNGLKNVYFLSGGAYGGKTTMAKFAGSTSAPQFHYEDVDVSLIKPRKRDYSKS